MSNAIQESLMAAVKKGVQCEDGVYRFFDPGIPLVALRQLPIVRERSLLSRHDWYDGYDWATREDAPQERILRLPVVASLGKTFAEQTALLSKEEEVASVRIVAIFLVIYALATGRRLLSNGWVRCSDQDSDGVHVDVGDFDSGGLGVVRWDDNRHDDLGLASSRKS